MRKLPCGRPREVWPAFPALLTVPLQPFFLLQLDECFLAKFFPLPRSLHVHIPLGATLQEGERYLQRVGVGVLEIQSPRSISTWSRDRRHRSPCFCASAVLCSIDCSGKRSSSTSRDYAHGRPRTAFRESLSHEARRFCFLNFDSSLGWTTRYNSGALIPVPLAIVSTRLMGYTGSGTARFET